MAGLSVHRVPIPPCQHGQCSQKAVLSISMEAHTECHPESPGGCDIRDIILGGTLQGQIHHTLFKVFVSRDLAHHFTYFSFSYEG